MAIINILDIYMDNILSTRCHWLSCKTSVNRLNPIFPFREEYYTRIIMRYSNDNVNCGTLVI